MNSNLLNTKWYKKWWGITLMISGCLIVALAVAFSATAYRYLKLIKAGQGDMLQKHFYGSMLSGDEEATRKKVRLAVETSDDPFIGNKDAEIVIVEFIDFKCPFCKQQNPEIKQLVIDYPDKIKLIVRDFPVESTHRGANDLAVYASCANEQNIYWPVHDYFFENQDIFNEELTTGEIAKLNSLFNLSSDKMAECLSSGRGRVEVNQDYASGLQNGLYRGTPTFFVNGYVLPGYIPYDTWRETIESL